jgi:hypothetical protein
VARERIVVVAATTEAPASGAGSTSARSAIQIREHMDKTETELWIAEILIASLAAGFEGDKELEGDLQLWRSWVHWALYTGEYRTGIFH